MEGQKPSKNANSSGKSVFFEFKGRKPRFFTNHRDQNWGLLFFLYIYLSIYFTLFGDISYDSLSNIINEYRRSFAVKDEIFCLFEGALDNLGSLKQQYGLSKSANEVVLVIEAYKALRDRAPYPANHVVGHLIGNFAFVVFDKSTSTLFVATVSQIPT